MTVSVIIPVYYGNKYLDNLITILNANYNILISNGNDLMEVVFINDSPSEPFNIDHSLCDFPVKIASNEENLGIHKSRINGLNICKGEYVLFLDQDDLITNDCILKHCRSIKGFDFCVSNGFFKYQNGEIKAIYKSENHIKCVLNLDFHYMYTNPIISPGQVLIKKSAIPNEWINNTFQNNGADDHYLWLMLLEKGNKGTTINEKLYTHVSTGNNTSLNIEAMYASNKELISHMKSISSRMHLFFLERRVKYYGSKPNSLLSKILYFDVGIIRRIFYQRFIR